MSEETQIRTVEYVRPWVYPKQEAAIFNDARYSCIEAGTKCFNAGTLVATQDGYTPIQKIKKGDKVLTWYKGKSVYKTVLKRFDNEGVWGMIRIFTKYGEIVCTQNHEFRTNSGWSKAIVIAERAMENKREVGISVFHQQPRTDRIEQIPGDAGPNWPNPTCAGHQRISSHDAFGRGEVLHGQNAPTCVRDLGWSDRSIDHNSPSGFRPGEQCAYESRTNVPGRQHSCVGNSGEIWQEQGQHKREFEAYGEPGFSDQNRMGSSRLPSARFSEEVRSKPNHYSEDSQRRLETRCIEESEIVGFECFEFSGTVHDLTIKGAENYCVTRQNISVHNCGKTVGCIIWLVEQAMRGCEGKNYWWVAPIFPQAKIAFRRMKLAIPRELYSANETELTITLINGATIWFKSGEKPDNLYGEDVYAAVMDECSRMREESWHAVRSTLTATRGKVRLIGNVKGRKNWFYKLCRKAEGGEPGMEFHRIRAQDAVEAKVLDAAEIEDARSKLPEDVFKQLYEADPADDEGNPFGFEFIEKGIRPAISKLPAVCGGRDLAKSHDWNVGINLDRSGDCCGFERFQLPWAEAMQRIKAFHGRAPTAIDSTGVGDPIVEDIQRNSTGLFEGYIFTSRSKQMLMENLAVMMQRGEIGYPDGQIVTELEAFEYVYTRTGVIYSTPEGMNDDCVCALALAAFMKSKIPKAFVFEAITKVDSRNWRGQKDATLF